MLLRENDIRSLERIYRLNLINSITGIKPANLVGSRSKNGQDNVAIFSSVVHLGSHPAQIGLVMRPQTNGTKDTYANIVETGAYTINHVSEPFIEKAHYTSAKLEQEEAEFDVMHLEREFIDGFFAPFVEQSSLKIGMRHLQNLPLPNQCIFIVGEIVLLSLPEQSIDAKGQIDLSQHKAVGISGLDSYYALKKIASFPYARRDELPHFNA